MIESLKKYFEGKPLKIKLPWFLLIGTVVFIPIFFLLVSIGLFGKLPDFEDLENPISNLASEIYTEDSVLLGNIYIDNRTNVQYGDISPNIVNALIATEDSRYYSHSGIDLRGTLRAMFFLGSKGGGSTITQQLSKMMFHKKPQSTIARIFQKIKEYLIAVRLERSYTKEEIIALYLNQFDFVNHAVGINNASKVYFSKLPSELDIQEAAMLVGMLQNPSLYNPLRRAELTLGRRNTVLLQMKKADNITKAQFDSLVTLPLGIHHTKIDHIQGLAPYFRSILTEFLKDWAKNNRKLDGSEYNIYKDGLKIYTTINSRMQKYAEEAVKEHLTEMQKIFFGQFKRFPSYKPWDETEGVRVLTQEIKIHPTYKALQKQKASKEEIDKAMNTKKIQRVFTWEGIKDSNISIIDSIKHHKMFLQTGFMATEPSTGSVKAWVGGINFEYFKYDHVNINTKRQVGSTFKPILYALAVDNGWSPCLRVPNVPVTIYTETGEPWTPKNAGGVPFGGDITLKKALAKSQNNIAAYLVKNLGPHALKEMAERMGVTSKMDPVYSLSLGSADVSLTEMMTVYSTFVNGGFRTTPIFVTRIEDKNGNIIQSFPVNKSEVLSEQTAFIMLEMLKGVVTAGGTAARIKGSYEIPGDVAGKTGTTNNHTDGWFMGMTPNLMAGVWVGCNDPFLRFKELGYGAGGRAAMPIWALFFKKVFADNKLKMDKEATFFKPKGELTIEWDCSKYSSSNARESFENAPEGIDLDNEFEL